MLLRWLANARADAGRPKMILVTGGMGFVGSKVISRLVQGGSTGILMLSRHQAAPRSNVTALRGDLIDLASITGICDGVETVLHLASYIGNDPEQCRLVNDEGTRHLLDQARRSGVRRVVYLSTAAVYGAGEHCNAVEDEFLPAPCSAVSASRLAAEHQVREFGGIVLRPHLIYGDGDLWFVPTLLKILDAVPAWIDGGSARMSTVSVDDLAAVIVSLAAQPWHRAMASVYHANHPREISVRELVGTICPQLNLPQPATSLPYKEYCERVRAAVPSITDHQLELLGKDHFYNSHRLWREVGVSPGADFSAQFPSSLHWYQGRQQAT